MSRATFRLLLLVLLTVASGAAVVPATHAAGETCRGAIWRRFVRQIAINSDAGMPLPETSATATPSRISERAKTS